MTLLRLAIEIQRWDLAAHIIILASATAINSENGTSPLLESPLRGSREPLITRSGDKLDDKKAGRRR